MDSRYLELFEAVYDTGSVTQAASRLYITRQTLSSGLAALEKELGLTLFVRTATGSKPTEAADVLKQYCIRQRKLWGSCWEEMHREASRKVLRVAGSMFFMQSDLFQDIMRMQELGHDTEVGFIDNDRRSEQIELLIDGEVDLAGMWQVPDDERLDPFILFASSMSILVSENSPLAQLPEVDYLEDLTETCLLFVSEETHARIASSLDGHAIKSQVIEPNLVLVRLLLESGKTALPIPHHHVLSVQAPGLVERRFVNYPLCSVTAACTVKPRSRLIQEFVAKWEADGPLKESMSWEDYLASGGRTPTPTYMFLPADEKRAWSIACPWFAGDYACCAQCRQAH